MRDQPRTGDDARIGHIRARDASLIRWIRAKGGGQPEPGQTGPV
jgi:hypothetical protein